MSVRARLRRALLSNPPMLICAGFIIVLTILALGVSLLPLPDPTAPNLKSLAQSEDDVARTPDRVHF